MRKLTAIFILFCSLASLWGQALYDSEGRVLGEDSRKERSSFASDSLDKSSVPVDLRGWKIEERFGTRIPAGPDTLMHHFQNDNFTEGRTGLYNYTGNLGAPRICRLYDGQSEFMMSSDFFFARPYDYFLTRPGTLFFTNTKSPFMNITYHSCGNKSNGEDRIKAQFAVNAGKHLGMGFKIDYAFGRGYYQNQNTSLFGGIVYASYLSDRYEMHVGYGANHLKNAENGGLEDDSYVETPDIYKESYRDADMPVRLDHAYNKLNVNALYLTHRYNLGQERDSLGFVPIASVIHTMKVGHHNRDFLLNGDGSDYFADRYLRTPTDSIDDFTRNINVENTVALEMREGFRKWVKMGMRLFFKHDYEKFTLPSLSGRETYKENYMSLGAQLMREKGRIFTYNVLGEIRTTGKDWGEFNVEGHFDFNIPLKKDSLVIAVGGYVRNEQPSFYYRHYHGSVAWWDNDDMNKVFRTRVGGSLRWRDTRLDVNVETIQNYTGFQHTAVTPASATTANCWLYGVKTFQASKNIQVISAVLRQDFTFGPLHSDWELMYQASSNQDLLPVPTFSGYTNLYLKFKIAKVLTTEFGADLRYFTKYYAPEYAPSIGQYCVQSDEVKKKIGHYPWINVYLNFHLKQCRFYVMVSHVNWSEGRAFLVPHYPTNQRIFHLGLSWNFIN